ncbi:helix-turn-helix domain-containing protein [Dethiobacter alkaliphilus]|uniref:helix-turn-helix domain-containing protein n=1 Tax=Dethiobacter alkaliphilus TaxID=427926 RepID=UPI0022273A4D|nr:helix-turn-helix transcriptional regulator [Dethiobacter alkaliphilus]MCW3491670.1 helix-turn-helix transcriptional regulator [Dethiobacter alkaliphilus]
MEFVRIGEKLINVAKIDEIVRRIVKMRSEGLSQQEVAAKLQLDRTFISRLESIGSVRKGGCLGLMAFPVENKEELNALADRYGIEQRLILSDKERWQLVKGGSGIDFFNHAISIIEQFQQCDIVLVFCSAKWNRLAAALLDNEVLTTEIGPSPITGDVYVNPQSVENMLKPFMQDSYGEGKR